MKIIHISDFHFKPGNKFVNRQEQIVQHFIKSSEIETNVDFIVFSGDLVNNGENQKDFESAYNILIDPLLRHFNLDNSQFFICPGNHDVNRNDVLKSIVGALDNIRTDNELNKFLFERDFEYSLKATNNYYSFVTQNLNIADDYFDPMFSVHSRKLGLSNIGIITINSAWRSVGIDDDNNLLFPTDKLNEALGILGQVDFKILIMHHPLSDFRQFNGSDLEDLIHNNFNLVLSGHVHKNKDTVDLLKNTGVIRMVAPASLSSDKESEIGIGLINIDFDNLEFGIKKYLLDSQNSTIYMVDKGIHALPSSDERKEINTFRLKLKGKHSIELDKARELMVSRDETIGKHFSEICADPVLKSKPQNTFSDEMGLLQNFDWLNFNEDNRDFHVFGNGKCGKTVLLKKIQLDLLDDYPTYQTIPYYIDCKDSNFKTGLDLEKEFFRYFEINKAKTSQLISETKVLLLIDNYHSASKSFILSLEAYLEKHRNLRIIICSDESIINTFENVKIDGRNMEKLYFHRLRKKHIKQLSKKLHNLPADKEEEIVNKIESIFNRLHIPFNFWTISLFIWIFKKDLNSNFQNDVELVNLYIEKLLEKDRLTIEQTTFGYEKYKRYLAFLAFTLLKDYRETEYIIGDSSLLSFTEGYLAQNPRYNITARELLSYIEEKGILKSKNENSYTFRLNGVFEFFIAHYMTIDKEFLNLIIQSEDQYLSYENEFELYAGFKRDDIEFLSNIFEKTKIIFKNINSKFNNIDENRLDQILKLKINELRSLKASIQIITAKFENGLSSEEQDQIEEELIANTGIGIDTTSEIKVKESFTIDSSIESLDKSLSILGRVFKNADEISENSTVNEIFDFIINTSCNWGFHVIDELKSSDIKDLIEESNEMEAKELLNLLTNIIPTLVQGRLYDTIGHKNLENIILNRIKLYSNDCSINQYRLFILFYLLVDINPRKYKDKLYDFIDLIDMPILQYSSILKLNFYIGFKAGEDQLLMNDFKKILLKQQLKFDPETNVGEHQKNVSKSIDTARNYKKSDKI